MKMMNTFARKYALRNELIVRIETPSRGRGDVRVSVENVERRDRQFVRALLRMLEIWLNAGRR